MAILYDTHMHSSFSTDSDAPMEKMAAAARKLSLAGICITEHLDLDFPAQYFPEIPGAFEADPEEVLRELLRVRALTKQEGSGFRIGFGMEFGMQPGLGARYHEIAQRFPFDFLIASQHLVGPSDPYYPETWDGKKPEEVIADYYSQMLSNLKELTDWDTLGHMDYIIRYIPDRGSFVYDSMARHADIIDRILGHVIAGGKCLEVNTAGYRYGLGQPNPSPSILKRYLELGGRKITIGADAHEPGQIASAFDEACRLLRSLGFESYCVFERRKMTEHQL